MHGEKKFECSHCHKKFCTKANLKMHIEKRKFSCMYGTKMGGFREKTGRDIDEFNIQSFPKSQKTNFVATKRSSVVPNRTAVQEYETQAAVDSIILVNQTEKPNTNIRTYTRKTDWSRQY